MDNWTLLKAYYEEIMKSNCDKATPSTKHSKILRVSLWKVSFKMIVCGNISTILWALCLKILGVSIGVYLVPAASCDETPWDLVNIMCICHNKESINLPIYLSISQCTTAYRWTATPTIVHLYCIVLRITWRLLGCHVTGIGWNSSFLQTVNLSHKNVT